MKILKFIVVLALTLTFSSCSSDESIALDEKIRTEIVGVWISTSEKASNSSLFAYEFKDDEIIYHKLLQSETTSYKVADFEISNGKIIITDENDSYKNKIEITSENILILGEDDKTEIFRKINENEKKEFYLP